MSHKIKLKIAETIYDSTVELDGVELEGVVRVSFDIVAGQRTLVKLEIYSEVEVEGEAFILTSKYRNKTIYPVSPRLSPDGTYYICDHCGREWLPGKDPGCKECKAAKI